MSRNLLLYLANEHTGTKVGLGSPYYSLPNLVFVKIGSMTSQSQDIRHGKPIPARKSQTSVEPRTHLIIRDTHYRNLFWGHTLDCIYCYNNSGYYLHAVQHPIGELSSKPT